MTAQYRGAKLGKKHRPHTTSTEFQPGFRPSYPDDILEARKLISHHFNATLFSVKSLSIDRAIDIVTMHPTT